MASFGHILPNIGKMCTEVKEEPEETTLKNLVGVEDIDNKIMYIKQEIDCTDDECKFKLEDYRVGLDEIKGENTDEKYSTIKNTIKQEITEEDFNEVDIVDFKLSIPSQYSVVGDDNSSVKISCKREIIVKEEDVKTSATNWVDIGKSEIFKCIAREHNYVSNIDTKSIHNLKNHKCLECTYETEYEDILKYHTETQHDVSTPVFTCKACFYQTESKQSLITHIKVEHCKKSIYECTKCNFRSKRLWNLQMHEKRKHNSSDEVFHCAQCFYEAKCKYYLIRHIRKQHCKNDTINKMKDNGHAIIYACSDCSFETRRVNYLTRHYTVHHNEDGEVYKCSECPYETKYEPYLTRHNKVCHGAAGYKCSYVATSENLTGHDIGTYDTNPVVYKCSKCPFEAKCKRYVTRHNTRIHDTNNVVYKCSECPYETRQKYRLVHHNEVQHNENAVDFNCWKCRYRTKHTSCVSNHPIIYACSDCSFETRHIEHLTRHNVEHYNEDEAVHKCSECSYETKHKGNLMKHNKLMHG